jgi:hypothetical protein
MPDAVGKAAQCVDGRAIEPLHVRPIVRIG